MQGDKMQDNMMMQKEKKRKEKTNKSKGEKSRGVTDDTTNKGSCPRNPPPNNRKRGVHYRVCMLHIDFLDTTNKILSLHLQLVDTTNKRLLLISKATSKHQT